jgi:hypothetical protein
MKGRIGVVAVLVVLVPSAVLAQAASPGREAPLQQELRQRRVIVRPITPPSEVQNDAEQAAVEVAKRAQQDAVARELTRPTLSRRPDLDYDVKSGIQQRALQNSLRR